MTVVESLWLRLRDEDIVAMAADRPLPKKYYFDRFLRSPGMCQTEKERNTFSIEQIQANNFKIIIIACL